MCKIKILKEIFFTCFFFISLSSAIQGRYGIFEYFLFCTRMEMLRFPWNLQEAAIFHLFLSTHVTLSASVLSPSTAIWWKHPLKLYPLKAFIRWCFIRWYISSWCFIRWWLLSVEALWSSVGSKMLISWLHFTYAKLQGIIYLQLTSLSAYLLVVNMTYWILSISKN